ncbi:ABC transporter permease [Pyrococcus sp. ST04]|uniref:ABC transporter permease n=1 Tax=Pyrococcus sp. ST04 TaxID=1183377 RepID=UPI0002605DAD|nr:ABC transporter permease [Pyrococcus sp. ST04]AFK22508.1 ABC transporter ATP-binding protein [Pyrococcus sp. ST04]
MINVKGILTIAKKECKIQLRYRVVWLNFALTPFFMLAPWVLTAKMFSSDFGEAVLVGSLMWYWLNQYFFGVQEAFEEEREEGTLISIALAPISLLEFLIGKGMWILVECIYITGVTMIIFWALGISQATSFQMFVLYILSGLYMFAFSILWGALVLQFRRIAGINFITQEILGMASGVTANITAYPRLVRIVAYAIPLSYTIKIGRGILQGRTFFEVLFDFAILTIITFLYFSIGAVLLKRAENNLRIKGGWEAW